MQTKTIERSVAAPKKAKLNAGVCAGTTIMTMEGEMPVEHLEAGMRIITRDSGMAILRKIDVATQKIAPIRIKAGSLGHTRPDRDIMVTPNTILHIRDWRAEALFGTQTANIEAARLVDGEYLAPQAAQQMTTYTLTFDRQHILYADGIEMASAAV
ncbi:Hint domain-containing protein [Loktanella sp. TSTF-M6]|uniref:Hint domain-containing protein n=1 Tax=Loktanella gaetbuli TaxID=2881335 RepID=A0ABS8BQ20_9RHOB|nr:Hint domain-containing protein [Loktanella gaetbuli]MCB5197820.1 Hint domain-containing protein [Loktanella gaetbuli]